MNFCQLIPVHCTGVERIAETRIAKINEYRENPDLPKVVLPNVDIIILFSQYYIDYKLIH